MLTSREDLLPVSFNLSQQLCDLEIRSRSSPKSNKEVAPKILAEYVGKEAGAGELKS